MGKTRKRERKRTEEEAYQEGYEQGFVEGFLIGGCEIMIRMARTEDPKGKYTNCMQAFYHSIYPEAYLDEVEAIMARYPRLSEKALAKKIIFEASYLPLEP